MAKGHGGGHGGGGGHESHVPAHPKAHHVEVPGHGTEHHSGPSLGFVEGIKKFFKSLTEIKPRMYLIAAATAFFLMTGTPLYDSLVFGLQSGIEASANIMPKIMRALGVKEDGGGEGKGGGGAHH